MRDARAIRKLHLRWVCCLVLVGLWFRYQMTFFPPSLLLSLTPNNHSRNVGEKTCHTLGLQVDR